MISLRPFHNKFYNHDFQAIHDTIKEYYPIKNRKRLTPESVTSSPGFQKISALIEENFVIRKNYRERWTKLNQFLKKEMKKPVRSTVRLNDCCYSGEVVLEGFKSESFIKSKKLHFYISLLGPFFSICGIDSSTVFLPVDPMLGKGLPGHFSAEHAVTVSPIYEYASMFNLLEDNIRAFFPGFCFVPYEIGMSTIKNISVEDDLRDPRTIDTVFEALFGQSAVHTCHLRGDRRYGFPDWIKPLNKKELKLNDTLFNHIINAPKTKSIHKVWKLKKHSLLRSFKQIGNLTMGLPLLDVLDLTDDKKGIIVQENGRPSEISYKLLNDTVELLPNLSLKIVTLTTNSLVVNLLVDFQHEETSLKGEVMQMNYVELKKLQ